MVLGQWVSVWKQSENGCLFRPYKGTVPKWERQINTLLENNMEGLHDLAVGKIFLSKIQNY